MNYECEVGTHFDLSHVNTKRDAVPVLTRMRSMQRSIGTRIVFVKALGDMPSSIPVMVR